MSDAIDPATPRRDRVGVLAWVIAGVATVLHAAASLATHAAYVNGYDLAIFDQAVRGYARFQAPTSMMLGQDANTLGEHFSPVLALFAPLYWVWDDPRMLLLGQAVVVGVSVPVVVRFARRHVGDRLALGIGVGYALGWPLQGLSGFDVHEIVFGVLFLALALDALDRRDDRWLLVWGLALLTVREDMGLILITLGLVRLLRRDRRWFGLVLIAVGAAGYLLVTAVVIPSLSSTGAWRFWSYDELGPDLPSSLRTILTEPLTAARLFVTPEIKLVTLALLFVPLLGLSLRSPYVLVALPLLAARNWSSRETLWQPFYHYSSVIWVVLVLAAVHGAALLRPAWRTQAWRALAAVPVLVGVVGVVVLPSVFALANAQYLVRPLPSDVRSLVDQRERLVDQVPPGTCVTGESAAMAHLLTTNVTGVTTRWTRDPDFVLLDRQAKDGAQSKRAHLAWATSRGYVEVDDTGRYVLLRSPTYAGPTAGCRP